MLINVNDFHENVDFLEEAILFIIDHYLTQFPIRSEAIENGIIEKDFDEIARTAHSIKNDISQFYAQKVYDNAIAIESEAIKKNMDAIKSLSKEFHILHQELHQEIIVLREKYRKQFPA
ncbi:MAG: hypothetical protein JEZ03_01430 [Bacteroidales bacterium]|nr:hypothetical protein [Bacteroidales bacterium]